MIARESEVGIDRRLPKRLDLPGCVFTVEVVLDPFHDDAFHGTPVEGYGAKGERRLVWYGVDAWGNLVVCIGPVVPGYKIELRDNEFWLVEDAVSAGEAT